MTTCLNCGNTFEGAYCPHCGQKADTKRLKLLELLRNTIGPFVGGDSKFLRTLRGLLFRPGHMVREYLLGKRAPYYNPLQLYIFLLTIYAILSYVLGASDNVLDDLAKLDFENGVESTSYASVDYIFHCVTKVTSNKLYGSFIHASFAALIFQKLMRKNKMERLDSRQLPLNITEHFYVQMYLSCIDLIITTVMLPLCLIKSVSEFLPYIFSLFSASYLFAQYRQLYGIRWWKSIWQSLLATILTMIVIIMIMVFFAIVAGVIEELGFKS